MECAESELADDTPLTAADTPAEPRAIRFPVRMRAPSHLQEIAEQEFADARPTEESLEITLAVPDPSADTGLGKQMHDFKAVLEELAELSNLGTYDGNLIGEGKWMLYLTAADGEALWESIRDELERAPAPIISVDLRRIDGERVALVP